MGKEWSERKQASNLLYDVTDCAHEVMVMIIWTLVVWLLDFYAPQLVPPGTAEARISYGNSVRPSVRPSVTTRWYTKHR